MEELHVPAGLTETKPIREIVYEFLREVILAGKIKPGERLVERDIAERFQASRTPVREALRKLESEGLLQYVPRKGDVVRAVDLAEVRETYAIRKALEELAIGSAMQHLTPQIIGELRQAVRRTREADKNRDVDAAMQGLRDFDEIVLTAAGMPLLKSFIQTLQSSLRRYRRINLTDARRRAQAIAEHEEILRAVEAGDAADARRAVASHIESSETQLLKTWC